MKRFGNMDIIKKISFLLFIITLPGCADMSSYHPQLSEQPKNAAKYESDRMICVAQSRERQKKAVSDYQSSGRWLMSGAFGLAGGAVDKATASSDADYNKTPMQMADECMSAKGYKVVKVEHCC